MLNISDKNERYYWNNKNGVDFPSVLNRRFRSKDTPFSVRQINSLAESGLLSENPKNGWRNYKFNEIIYLLLLKELKKYSLEASQLCDLKKCFYRNGRKRTRGSDIVDSYVAIALVLMEVRIFLVINDRFSAIFTDLDKFEETIAGKSFVCVDLNQMVDGFLKRMNIEA